MGKRFHLVELLRSFLLSKMCKQSVRLQDNEKKNNTCVYNTEEIP